MRDIKLIYECPETGYSVYQEDYWVIKAAHTNSNPTFDWILVDTKEYARTGGYITEIARSTQPKVSGPKAWIKHVIKTRFASANRRVKSISNQLTHASGIQASWAEKLEQIQ